MTSWLMMGRPTPEPDPYDPDQLLTIQQVARLCQMSKQTIRNRIAAGTFLSPTHRDGRWVRWQRAAVIEFLDGFQRGE